MQLVGVGSRRAVGHRAGNLPGRGRVGPDGRARLLTGGFAAARRLPAVARHLLRVAPSVLCLLALKLELTAGRQSAGDTNPWADRGHAQQGRAPEPLIGREQNG